MLPHSPSTTTASSSRIGSAKAICRPAMKLPTVERAATPAMIPAIPAEASRLAPMVRPSGKVSSTVASASTMIPSVTTRPTTRTWVRARRARRLSGMSTSRRRLSASSATRTARSASHAPATTSATTRVWLSGEYTLGPAGCSAASTTPR